MMWFLFLLYIARTEPVISQGSPGGENRLVLKGERPCEGHIEVYHDGEWGYAGHTYWDDNIKKVVCKNAHCGEPNTTETIFRPDNKRVWLNDIECNGTEDHLWECKVPAWGVLPDNEKYMEKITCSDEIEISLDGQSCAGAVTYSINGKKKGYFCADDKNWGKAQANVVCESIGCGSAKEDSYNEWTSKDFKDSEKTMLDCSGITDYKNLWQCVTVLSTAECTNPVSVKCADHERLQLSKEANTSNACSGQLQKVAENGNWINVTNASNNDTAAACHQMHCGSSRNYNKHTGMLTCTDTVSVVLMDNNNPSRCYGEVHVEVNNKRHPVCASTWTSTDAQVVCRELNCGSVVSDSPQRRGSGGGIMENVKCSGTESSLWHCGAKHDKDAGFQCSNIAHVACSESVNMRLMDGPGQCAGRVEIHYKGKWWRVKEQGWKDTNSEIVCKQLNCGEKRATSEKFCHGSVDFLHMTVECKQGAKNISECTVKESSGGGGGGFGEDKAKAVSITCEGHKVVFLEGTCSGKVGIEHGDKTYWLSGNNNTWNNEAAHTVCRQMHCGEMLDWSSDSSANLNNIWEDVYNCPPNSTSLFRCNASKLPPDHNETAVATVTCSGNLTMKLTRGCWGSVNVCMGGQCGGVCRDSWTDEKSKMLCEELGCGNKILPAHKTPGKTKAIIKSLHTTEHTKNLTQCNFIKNNEPELTCEPAYVVCSGSARPQFDGFNSRYSCSGNVEVFYEGEFFPVCSTALSSEAQNAICEELKCGPANKTLDYFGSTSGKTAFISNIQCPANAKSLTACTIDRNDAKCPLGGLQCSEWKKVELNLGKKACSGDVFVESKKGRMAFPADNWTDETMGRTLCKDLNCGDFIKSHYKSGLYPFWDRIFSCQDGEKPENIWKCEKARQPSKKLQLSIECQDPNVTLSGECHGEVRINNTRVCSSKWNNDYSNKLCKEKSCGSIALFHDTGKQQADMYHVSYDQCDRLGECNRYKETCANGPVSVYCVRNVEFNTTERCGGQIEIIYQDRREKVCAFPTEFQDELCKALGCEGFNSVFMRKILKDKSQKEKAKKVKVQKTVDCSSGYTDYKYCVKTLESCDKEPAEIYCKGYNFKPSLPPPSSSTPVMAIVVGIGLILVLVILIAVFVRVYIVRRARRAKMAMNASRMYSRKEVEFESGDYEDVTNKANEMEDLSHDNFRRDADVFMESDERSNTSLPYDDIDEAETRPLTSPAPTKAGVSVDSYFQDGTPDQSTDGVTYEVDDPQENYDDIEPGPEVTETKAEVHASPETTPESVPAAPPGRVQGEEDYLVPGQDG